MPSIKLGFAEIAQLVERTHGKGEVPGSNPGFSSILLDSSNSHRNVYIIELKVESKFNMQNYYKEPKPALIIIDMLNAYFAEGASLHQSKDSLVTNINELVDYVRKIEIPVIWVRQEYKEDLSDAPLYNKKNNKVPNTIVGKKNSQLLDELHFDPNDITIIKKRYSPFYKTNLEDCLKRLGVNTLIIAGVNSMTCVRVAVNDAYQMDYEVILALDCVDGYDKLQHDAAIKYMQYSQSTGMKNPEIIEELKKLRTSSS